MSAISKEKLLHSAEEELELVSGSGVVVGIPLSLPRLILGGQIPSEHLRDIALAYHYDPKWVPDDDHLGTPEERQAWEDFMDYCVAAYLVRPKIEPHEVRALNERDRIQLFRRATHQDLGDELQFANASFRLRAAGIAVGGNGAGATNGTKRSRGDRV